MSVNKKYLTAIEIEDLKASRKERVKGLTKQFTSVEDLFAWLDDPETDNRE